MEFRLTPFYVHVFFCTFYRPQQLESKDLTEVDHDILVSSPTESLMQTEDISKPEAEKNFSSTTAKSQR